MTFTFTVGYTPHPKADTEIWDTEEIEASSEEKAREELDARYPSERGYTYALNHQRTVSPEVQLARASRSHARPERPSR